MKIAARATVVALLFASTSAFAGTLADIHILNRSTGQRLPLHYHAGKTYVAGNPGDRYAVQVVNRTGARILTVISVDGVNVISGETASHEQTGYVFSPWESYEITGWRKSENEVAAFYFTSLPDSYAARTDRPQNVGVIGVAVFREWKPPRRRPVMPAPRPFQNEPGARAPMSKENRSDSAAESSLPFPAPSLSSPPARERESIPPAARRLHDKLGTGHGERERSEVTYTDFRRASRQPNEILTIHYDRYENLVARGIISATPRLAEPHPFPSGRFVPDPRS
ncbi:MAG: hypothetical protein HY695_26720 [Deltaproteobacteria bacterium]|nr:hypothetical protein [Deltaproteobacteria bacterium]